MCSVNFLHIGAHPRLPGAGGLPLYKLHFVTVCPARNALMVFGLISHQLLTIHLLVLSLLLLPMLPPRNLLATCCRLKIARACFNSESLLQFSVVAGYERSTTGWLEGRWLDRILCVGEFSQPCLLLFWFLSDYNYSTTRFPCNYVENLLKFVKRCWLQSLELEIL